MSAFTGILDAPRITKKIISIFVDIAIICVSYWLAYLTALNGKESTLIHDSNQISFFITLILTIVIFSRAGLYRPILRYMDMKAVLILCVSVVFSSLSLKFFSYIMQTSIPGSMPIIYAAYLIVLCGGLRLWARFLINKKGSKNKTKVIVYGAGVAGRQLVNILCQNSEYHPVCFVDDDKKIHHSSIHGLDVYGSDDIERLVKHYNAEKVLLAMPSATRSQRKKIIESLIELPVEELSVPNLNDIVSGKLSIDNLQDVAIEDLLGRNPVAPREALMEANLKNKVVMVTGAGGSIGSELCRQIIKYKPKVLVLFELSEFALYQIDRELSSLSNDEGLNVEVIPLLGSVQRINRLVTVMSSFNVQTVYHAAAYKHVPLVENNVVEGVRNNVFGTYYTAKAALEAKVELFVLISTDKAVRPTNVMGATKRMGELGLQALAEAQKKLTEKNVTYFSIVRFGNVLGSSGSVIPVFKRQIMAGGPITVTHKDIIRYFMTIPEAAQLVIQAGAMSQGGDVFVLDMGQPVKIVELAKKLIKLSGLELKDKNNSHGDIDIKFTGLRPGEKLYEELLIDDNNIVETTHERIMRAQEPYLALDEYNVLLDELNEACHELKHERIQQLLLDASTGFTPIDGINDLVWIQNKKTITKSALIFN